MNEEGSRIPLRKTSYSIIPTAGSEFQGGKRGCEKILVFHSIWTNRSTDLLILLLQMSNLRFRNIRLVFPTNKYVSLVSRINYQER